MDNNKLIEAKYMEKYWRTRAIKAEEKLRDLGVDLVWMKNPNDPIWKDL